MARGIARHGGTDRADRRRLVRYGADGSGLDRAGANRADRTHRRDRGDRGDGGCFDCDWANGSRLDGVGADRPNGFNGSNRRYRCTINRDRADRRDRCDRRDGGCFDCDWANGSCLAGAGSIGSDGGDRRHWCRLDGYWADWRYWRDRGDRGDRANRRDRGGLDRYWADGRYWRDWCDGRHRGGLDCYWACWSERCDWSNRSDWCGFDC